MWFFIGLIVGCLFGFFVAIVGQAALEDTAVKTGIIKLRSEGGSKYYSVSEIKRD
jgi:hypothetical protein